jgi:hypothetical protein
MAIVRILCLFMPSLQLSKLLYGNCPGDRHTLAITNILSRLYEIHQRLNKKQQAISLVHSFYLWPGPRFLTMPRYTNRLPPGWSRRRQPTRIGRRLVAAGFDQPGPQQWRFLAGKKHVHYSRKV